MKVLSLVTNRHAPFYEKQVSELEKRGIDVTHVNPSKQASDINRTPIDYTKMYVDVLREARNEYDLVHANSGLTVLPALLQPNRPIVLSLWGSDIHGRVGQVSMQCAKLCDEVIVMSSEMDEKLDTGTTVIPHGIDKKQFCPISQRAAQAEKGWDHAKKHILFPYDPSRDVKNYPLAERVAKKTGEQFNLDTELQVVYGVDHGEIPVYMNAADALLITSHREGAPNSVKEAMACNLPVVSTDVGWVRDRLPEVSNSYVCRSEDELVDRLGEVLSDGSRSDGRQHLTGIGIEKMGDDITKVYQRAIER